jgi:KaiC/GvpD/RAD55 family RecA-like ATPase
LVSNLKIPILEQLVPGGFEYGQLLLVVYDPDSLWYETSLTIAAQGVRSGVRVEYHAYEHLPDKIREAFTSLGVNVKKLEEEDTLRILDSYTVQTGLSSTERHSKSKIPVQPLKLSDSSIEFAQLMKAGIPEVDKKWLHIDDNTGIQLQYNDEKTVMTFTRTRIPSWVKARETTIVNSLVNGITSDSFYKQYLTLYDGIIDFKNQEREELEHLIRVRLIRGKSCDSRWHRLKILDNGEVALLT